MDCKPDGSAAATPDVFVADSSGESDVLVADSSSESIDDAPTPDATQPSFDSAPLHETASSPFADSAVDGGESSRVNDARGFDDAGSNDVQSEFDQPTDARPDATSARDSTTEVEGGFDASEAGQDADAGCSPGPQIVASGVLAIGQTAPTDLYYTGQFLTNQCVQLTDSNASSLYVPSNTAIPHLTTGLTILHTLDPAGPGMTPPLTQPAGEYTIDTVSLTYNPATFVYTWSFHGVDYVTCQGCRYVDSVYYRVVVQ